MEGISFSQAVEGYFLHAHSRMLSACTVADYSNTFRRFQRFLAPEDPMLAEISLETVEAFIGHLDGLSRKSVLNYHTGLSALWTWALKRRLVDQHVIRQIDPPKPEKTAMEIFTEEDVQHLLQACDRAAAYSRPGKRKCSNARPTALRDKAIILTLLDSIVRVTELCEMQRLEMKLKEGKIKVFGKGAKERWAPISSETVDLIWRYLATRPRAKPRHEDRVFLSLKLMPMNRRMVGKLLQRLGKKVGVHAHAHKFRHTGATMFLRNGGNVFALKEILGHSTMEMVQRYVHLAQVDIEEAHRQASPVYNWDLKV